MGIDSINIEFIVEQELANIAPYVKSHGGDICLIRIENDVVFLALKGACSTCPLSFYTVSMGIETRLKHKIPTLKEVKIIEG